MTLSEALERFRQTRFVICNDLGEPRSSRTGGVAAFAIISAWKSLDGPSASYEDWRDDRHLANELIGSGCPLVRVFAWIPRLNLCVPSWAAAITRIEAIRLADQFAQPTVCWVENDTVDLALCTRESEFDEVVQVGDGIWSRNRTDCIRRNKTRTLLLRGGPARAVANALPIALRHGPDTVGLATRWHGVQYEGVEHLCCRTHIWATPAELESTVKDSGGRLIAKTADAVAVGGRLCIAAIHL